MDAVPPAASGPICLEKEGAALYLSVNLLCTLLIWAFFALVFLSNPRNRLNQLCFLAGMLFSLGTFKEFFYYDLGPLLTGMVQPEGLVRVLYAWMTAGLYLCAMPAALLFCYCFREAREFRHSHPGTRALLLCVPALALAAAFPPWESYALQRTSVPFWVCFCIYNLTYGVCCTVLLVLAVLGEQDPAVSRQKRLVSAVMLPLMWYWLITIFVFHTFQLYPLLHLWQGCSVLLLAALGFYLAMAVRGGMMGVRLKIVRYQWDSEAQTAFRGVHFISHAIRKDLTKFSWCAENLRRHLDPPPPEAEIIARSARHLDELCGRVSLYSGELHLSPAPHRPEELWAECGLEGAGEVSLSCPPGALLLCDLTHTAEVLRNLLDNAREAAGEDCRVRVEVRSGEKLRGVPGRFTRLSVSDNGPGIPKALQKDLFLPFTSQKAGDRHMGLGLFYCQRVMQAHSGAITAQNLPGGGACFQLYFPERRPSQ